jgi:signal transduction histidine kinase
MADEGANSPVTHAYAQLLSLAVHELRTPASVVSGYLRMLQRDTDHPLSERQRRMVDEADKSCARLVALIGELSELSKLDAGTASGKEETFDLVQLIEEVAADVHEAEDREVHLVVRGDVAAMPMKGDLRRVRSAFEAFFRAILREQPAQTTVVAERRRRTDESGTSAVVVVARDTDVQRSYEAPAAPFDEKRGGLGLALPIACRVIERHGGRIWSPAVAEGAGGDAGLSGRSAVLVSLPIREPRS